MVQTPETRYADSRGVSIAYQVVGEGPGDLVFIFGWVSNLDVYWSNPLFSDFMGRLAEVSRVILFDKRGTGLSDPVSGSIPFDSRMDDVRAVMDAAGSTRAVVFGYSEGVPISILFAATHPSRTEKLVLGGGFANREGFTDDYLAPLFELVEHWGQGKMLDVFAPSRAGDPAARGWAAAFERASASPAMARQLLASILEVDVGPALAAVKVPTLVLHHSHEFVPVEKGREIADGIVGARFVEIPGRDHAPWGEGVDRLLTEVLEFITGRRPSEGVERALATVLVTDLVGSTQRAAEVGDRRWKELLSEHDRIVRRQLERFGAVEVNFTGDGFIATFDGPSRALRCGLGLADGLGRAGLPVRVGLHTGEVELAGQGTRGIALHIATRVVSEAAAGEVLASSTVRDLVFGSELHFDERGTRVLKGVPGEWRLYAVRPADPSA